MVARVEGRGFKGCIIAGVGGWSIESLVESWCGNGGEFLGRTNGSTGSTRRPDVNDLRPSWTRKSSAVSAPTAFGLAVSTNRPPKLKSRTWEISLPPSQLQRTKPRHPTIWRTCEGFSSSSLDKCREAAATFRSRCGRRATRWEVPYFP